MFLILTAFTVGGVWVAIGLRTGFWTPHFLAVIPLLTFYFAILYAVSTLAAVLTRSTPGGDPGDGLGLGPVLGVG